MVERTIVESKKKILLEELAKGQQGSRIEFTIESTSTLNDILSAGATEYKAHPKKYFFMRKIGSSYFKPNSP